MLTDIVFLIISTAIAILVGWITDVIKNKNKSPLWHYKSCQIYEYGISQFKQYCFGRRDIKMRQDFEEVYARAKKKYVNAKTNSLSVIYLAFWNNGKETITKEMIAGGIKVAIYDSTILDARIVNALVPENSFDVHVSDDKKIAFVEFKYIDYKQGAIIEIISDSSHFNHVYLHGELMGCKIKKIGYKREHSQTVMIEIFTYMVILFGLSSLISLFLSNYFLRMTFSTIQLILNLCIVAYYSYEYFKKMEYKLPKEFKRYFTIKGRYKYIDE